MLGCSCESSLKLVFLFCLNEWRNSPGCVEDRSEGALLSSAEERREKLRDLLVVLSELAEGREFDSESVCKLEIIV